MKQLQLFLPDYEAEAIVLNASVRHPVKPDYVEFSTGVLKRSPYRMLYRDTDGYLYWQDRR